MLENDLVMYLLVNKDLDMSIGKTAVQCARAFEVMSMEETGKSNEFGYLKEDSLGSLFKDSYDELFEKGKEEMQGNKIIALGIKQKEIDKVLNGTSKIVKGIKEMYLPYDVNFYPVNDMGLTEIEKGSITVIAVTPIKRKDAKPFKRLQLLK